MTDIGKSELERTLEERVRHLELYGTFHVDSWIEQIWSRLNAASAEDGEYPSNEFSKTEHQFEMGAPAHAAPEATDG